MSVASNCYQPVSRWTDLDRLTVFASPPGGQDLWTEVHDDLQEQLAALEKDVCRSVDGVRVVAGSTRGEHFLLFSYRTFSLPESDIDPVVVGMTFTQTHESVNVEADVSGEQTGDSIVSAHRRTAAYTKEELVTTARELAQELRQSAEPIAAALKNSSRKVE